MAFRRLAETQPDDFAFSAENQVWAKAQLEKFPEGRQRSAVIPYLWRSQEQEGWVTRPAIEHIAGLLDMPVIRVLEVATFYTMFHLAPVGKHHIQVCGTTPCMLRGSEDIIKICKSRISNKAKQVTEDGQFSWEEVECLGACVNAPMVQIFKDFYEDLTPERFEAMLDDLANGKELSPGPQNSRHSSEAEGGATTLLDMDFSNGAATPAPVKPPKAPEQVKPKAEAAPAHPHPPAKEAAPASSAPVSSAPASSASVSDDQRPDVLSGPREGKADDLKQIKGVGPKLEALLHTLGFYHFDQVAAWTDNNVAWVDIHLEGFKGRVKRDDWVNQAGQLARGQATEFSKRVAKGEVASSKRDG